MGTDETFMRRPRPEDSLRLRDGRWANTPGEVVLGSTVAQNKGLKVGDRINAFLWAGTASDASLSAPPRGGWDF